MDVFLFMELVITDDKITLKMSCNVVYDNAFEFEFTSHLDTWYSARHVLCHLKQSKATRYGRIYFPH